MASPKHERLREVLLAEVRRLQPHDMLPTERELAATHGVSRATIRQALDHLGDLGLVYRIQGAGTFVHGTSYSKTLLLTSFSEDVRDRGMEPSSRLLAIAEEPAGDELAAELDITAGDPVTTIRRLRLADDQPMCLETVRIASAKVPELDEKDVTGSLYEILEGRYGVRLTRADQLVRAVALDHEDAAALEVAPGSPAFAIHRVALDERDRPIECSDSIYRADLYDMRFTIRR